MRTKVDESMLTRPLDQVLRPWQKSASHERFSMRAAIVFSGTLSLLLWLGLAALLRHFL